MFPAWSPRRGVRFESSPGPAIVRRRAVVAIESAGRRMIAGMIVRSLVDVIAIIVVLPAFSKTRRVRAMAVPVVVANHLRGLVREGEVRGGRGEREKKARGDNRYKAGLEHMTFSSCASRRAAGGSPPRLNRADGRIGRFPGHVGGGTIPVSPHFSFLVGETGILK